MIDILKAAFRELREDKFLWGMYFALICQATCEVLGWNRLATSWWQVVGLAVSFPILIFVMAALGAAAGRWMRRMEDREPKNQLNSPGIGLCGFVFLIFLVLKLGVGETAVVDWSWWAVTAPLWGPALLALVFLIPVGIVMLVKAVRA
ncbi:membrane protein [Rhodococcus phage GuyFagieri]|nr:membrane protein [Rhodococcus phage GuyFagieri]